MDIQTWKEHLSQLPLGELYLYQELGSTNTVAEELIHQGAPHLSLVVANSQTAGKGRSGRSWVTKPGKSLAFSLILRPDGGFLAEDQLEKISGLGALAVAETLTKKLGLEAEIKWPNDVLVGGKKVSGILVDLDWQGSDLKGIVIGIGVNVFQGSVPDIPLNFPASSLEEEGAKDISRLELLNDLIQSILHWYPRVTTQSFITAWDAYLAFKDQEVIMYSDGKPINQGKLIGISGDGTLILLSDVGEKSYFRTGEIYFQLVDRS
jgi:BirA family biotin operon repressor/biotin-[acetyl-CoA-carboxylase] ligase